MRQNIRTRGSSSEKTVKDIRRATRKQYNHVRPHQSLNMRPENGGDKIVHRSGGISLPWAE